MPASPLIQLVAVGQTDEYLSFNPQLSYFKYVYKRHTRFALESLKVTFDGKSPNLRSVQDKCRVKIPRHGDMLSDINLVMHLPNIYSNSENDLRFRWIDNFATLLIREANIYLGGMGKPIDVLYGEWITIWNELSMSTSRQEQYNVLTGNIESNVNPKIADPIVRVGKKNRLYFEGYPYSTPNDSMPSIPGQTVVVPLPFYFTRNMMLGLPLCALQTSEVIVTFDIENVENLYQVYDSELEMYVSPQYYNSRHYTTITIRDFVTTTELNAYLEVKYAYLNEAERRVITANKQNNSFLIEQLYMKQVEVNDISRIVELNLTTPVKELIWVLRRRDYKRYNTPTNYTQNVHGNGNKHIMSWARILWNKSNERVEEKDAIYYGKIVPYQSHTKIPKTGIYCYSYAIYPEKWQPSGYYNPSGKYGINSSIQVGLNRDEESDIDYTITVYAKTYNILDILGGMAGFKFAT